MRLGINVVNKLKQRVRVRVRVEAESTVSLPGGDHIVLSVVDGVLDDFDEMTIYVEVDET